MINANDIIHKERPIRILAVDDNPAALYATSRVLIRPELRTWAGLEKDVTLLGMGSHFELWATSAYAATEAAVMQGAASAALDDLKF